MAQWIACALCALVIVKPQEFLELLAGLPLVYVAFFATLAAVVAALVQGRIRLSPAPQVPFVIAFFAWALVVTALKSPATFLAQLMGFAILGGLFAAVAVGCASKGGARAFALTFAACAALASVVAAAQSRGPLGCFLAAPEDWEGRGELRFDGRACETVADCRKDAPVVDGNYRCELRGPLNTASIGGRVRYRGSLADPNELSLAISIALPFALALASGRRRAAPAPRPVALPPLLGDDLLRRAAAWVRRIPAAAQIALTSLVVILSRSRSGMLVFLTVVGFQFIRRAGAWGIVAGAILGPPVLLLGGRRGAEADDSADERVEILREAFEHIRRTKGIGLGAGQFSDESSIGMTAHNAYLLAAAETGLVGYLLFAFAIYLSIKVPVVVWLADVGEEETRFAPAIVAALAGAMVGLLFLSWTYKDVLYMVMGASAALYSAARARDSRLRVGLSVREALAVSAAAVGLLAVLYVGARMHR